jgi:hypothetical protein
VIKGEDSHDLRRNRRFLPVEFGVLRLSGARAIFLRSAPPGSNARPYYSVAILRRFRRDFLNGVHVQAMASRAGGDGVGAGAGLEAGGLRPRFGETAAGATDLQGRGRMPVGFRSRLLSFGSYGSFGGHWPVKVPDFGADGKFFCAARKSLA